MTLIDESLSLERLSGVYGRKYTGTVVLTPGPGFYYGEELLLEFENSILVHAYAKTGKIKQELERPIQLAPTDPFYYNVEFLPGTRVDQLGCDCSCASSHGEMIVPDRSTITFGELFSFPVLRPSGQTARDLEDLYKRIDDQDAEYRALLREYQAVVAIQQTAIAPVPQTPVGDSGVYLGDVDSILAEVLGG